MTIVYSAPRNDEPQLHALVIGCGRFHWFAPDHSADRQACFDSAVEMIAFLHLHAAKFLPSLGSIDCLLADPSVDPDQSLDHLPAVALGGGAGQAAIEVARPLEANVVAAFNDLVARCQPGDAVLFYGCSHGVAGRDETGLLVLEDVGSSPGNRWAQLLNVKSVAQYLPAKTRASEVWVFLDACQEVMGELKDQVGGARTIEPVVVSSTEMAACEVISTGVAAARYGTQTHAPAGGGIAYFTRALLDGLGRSCVEKAGPEWRVTAKQINYGLVDIANASEGRRIEATLLTFNNNRSYLLRVDDPSIPVYVTSRPSTLLANATSVSLLDEAGLPIHAKEVGVEWRFRVPPLPASYPLRMVTGETVINETLDIAAPAVVRELGS